MKKTLLLGLITYLFALAQLYGQTSASTNAVAQPIPDRTVPYNVTATGESKPLLWGLDTAWPSEPNMRRGVAFMGSDQVDLVRVSFQPTHPLVNGDLQQAQIDWINTRLDLVNLAGPNAKLTLNCDHPSVDPWYSGNAANWAALMDVTARRYQDAGRTIVSIAPFNEPDYGWGQGTMQDFYDICGILRTNSRFNNIRISGGNTLNNDQALTWYNFLKDRLDEGNTHQLAGTFDNFANFYQTVRANGDYATGDELHNVMEAMVGVQYGMQAGIWWGSAELARGEFVKASDGQRLGYAEHRPFWTAASVYRHPNGRIQAFAGCSERGATNTTYRFVSKDRAVYYDGYGPQYEYTLPMPGGTGYNQGQPNAERVINITWGEDIQPVINGRYVLVNRSTGKVMEVADGSTSNLANVQVNTNLSAPYQQWNVTPVDSRIGGDFSYFTITAVHNAKSPDVMDWSLDNGTGIIMYDDLKGANQQWFFDYVSDGWFYIRSRHSAKCLDIGSDGTTVVQWDINGGLDQQWRLIPFDAQVEFVAPTAPTNLVATANAESIRLSWTANAENDLAGYTIFRATAAAGPYNTIARNVVGTIFIDNTATSGGPYYYKIKAVDRSLNRSGYSNQVSATPTGAKDLLAHYTFDGTLADNSINLNHSASLNTSFGASKVGTGAVVLNGSNAFIQLPPNIADQQAITIAAWVFWNGGSAWQRIFDFGNDESQNMFLTPNAGSQMRFAIKNGGAEQVLNAPVLPTGVWTHVAVTLGSSGARLFVNGALASESTTITIRPIDFKPVLNYIGRSQYPDPLLNGRIDEFKVYNYALTPVEISNLSGALYFQARNRSTGLFLDGMGRTTNGSNCGQYANTAHINSQWDLIEVGNGYYQLQNRGTGLLLDGMGRTTNGSIVGQYANTNHPNSHWVIEQYSGNYYRLQNRGTGLYIDGSGLTTNGADVLQRANAVQPSAQWEFITIVTAQSIDDVKIVSREQSVPSPVYPNPASSHVNIKLPEGLQSRVNILSVSGTIVRSFSAGDTDGKVDVVDLPAGVYVIEVITYGNRTRSRFVKE